MHALTNRKRLTVSAAVIAVLALSGVAFAFWTGSGSGSASAGVGTSGTVTIAATVTGGAAPGTSVPVRFAASNATKSPITVTTVHLVSVAADASHQSCVTKDFTMEDVTESFQVAANSSAVTLPVDGALAFANTAVNQDACKGATLTLTLSSL